MIRILGAGNSLITGLQGAGKSHFVISQVKQILDDEPNINVFIANVDGITLQAPNLHIVDADFSWVNDAPNNSLIIYDEAGTIKRFNNSSRAINSAEDVQQITMARHQNKTLVFIAQDSSIVHPAIRKLLTRHFHFSNPYNNKKQTHCFVFPQVQDRLDGQNKYWQNNAVEEFKHELDPDIFPLYKSVDTGAEHNKKKQVNKKAQLILRIAIVSLVIAIPLFILMIYMAKSYYDRNLNAQFVNAKVNSEQIEPITNNFNPVDTEQSQLTEQGNRFYRIEQELYNERLPPDYQVLSNNDDLRISGVIVMHGVCKAYNNKGERIKVSQSECRHQLSESGNMIKSRSQNTVVTSHGDTTLSDDITQKPDE